MRYNKSVDWYALGVLIYEMLSGLPPFHEPDITPVRLYEKIAQGPACIKWPNISPSATDLIMKFMERDPSKRYGNLHHGAGDVFAHPWFREVDWERLRNREIQAPYMPKIAGDGDASAWVSLALSRRRETRTDRCGCCSVSKATPRSTLRVCMVLLHPIPMGISSRTLTMQHSICWSLNIPCIYLFLMVFHEEGCVVCTVRLVQAVPSHVTTMKPVASSARTQWNTMMGSSSRAVAHSTIVEALGLPFCCSKFRNRCSFTATGLRS